MVCFFFVEYIMVSSENIAILSFPTPRKTGLCCKALVFRRKNKMLDQNSRSLIRPGVLLWPNLG